MDFDRSRIHVDERFRMMNLLPEVGRDQLASLIREGLEARPKRIPSMFFYDETGSRIYEEITRLPEYYPPQIEMDLVRRAAERLAPSLKGHDIVELGSGDCSKISLVLERVDREHLPTIRYVPVDFSQSAIVESASRLMETFGELEILGIVGDFLNHLDSVPTGKPRLFVFLGSTIGNLEKEGARSLLHEINAAMGDEDRMLLGVDMVKDRDVLEMAYNDSQGVTAAFNRNIINVVNALLETDLDPHAFEHIAFFNEEASRIEMHLRAIQELALSSNGYDLSIGKGEMIHTENSYKFTLGEMETMLEDAGLGIDEVFSDDRGWFSLILTTPAEVDSCWTSRR